LFPFNLLNKNVILMVKPGMHFLQCHTITLDNNMKEQYVQGIEMNDLPAQMTAEGFSVVKRSFENVGGGEQHA